MLELVKGCHKRTGLTETSCYQFSVCTNSTLQYSFYRNSAGTSRKCLVYPEFRVCMKWTPLHTSQHREYIHEQVL